MIAGYARGDQHLDEQISTLEGVGVDRIFTE